MTPKGPKRIGDRHIGSALRLTVSDAASLAHRGWERPPGPGGGVGGAWAAQSGLDG